MTTLKSPPRRYVSFVLYGDKALYLNGALENARLIPSVYPGWKGRFYVSDDVPARISEQLRSLDAEVIAFRREDWPGSSAMLIRFMAANEIGVDTVVFRDADSRVNPREAMAVKEWLETPTATFHLMHEALHDAKFGEVMGGMWGVRRATKGDTTPPLAGIDEAIQAFVNCSDASSYGADMVFLSEWLVPQLRHINTVHHCEGDPKRPLGLLASDISRRGYPETAFAGFVGAPVNCSCGYGAFAITGCEHCSRKVPGSVASRLGAGGPDVMAALAGFLA